MVLLAELIRRIRAGSGPSDPVRILLIFIIISSERIAGDYRKVLAFQIQEAPLRASEAPRTAHRRPKGVLAGSAGQELASRMSKDGSHEIRNVEEFWGARRTLTMFFLLKQGEISIDPPKRPGRPLFNVVNGSILSGGEVFFKSKRFPI